MKRLILSSRFLLGIAMLIAAGLTVALTPTRQAAGGDVDLEALIPRHFGRWVLDPNVTPLIVSPDAKAQLERIYSQTLSRTYVNNKGERIMLSIAYGAEQSRALQVHKPEVCYAMQGFQISAMVKDVLSTATAGIPVMHMMAVKGTRLEPITYWIRVGDDVVRGWYEQNVAKLKYGLSGKVPDGLLVRVSNFSGNTDQSYRLHREFVSDLLAVLPPEHRGLLIGLSANAGLGEGRG